MKQRVEERTKIGKKVLDVYKVITKNNCEIERKKENIQENILEYYKNEEEIVHNEEKIQIIMEEWSENNRRSTLNGEIEYFTVENRVVEKIESYWVDSTEVENNMMKAVEVPKEVVYEMKIEDYKVERNQVMENEILRTDEGRQCDIDIVPEQETDNKLKFFREVKLIVKKNFDLWKTLLRKKTHRKYKRKKYEKYIDCKSNGNEKLCQQQADKSSCKVVGK